MRSVAAALVFVGIGALTMVAFAQRDIAVGVAGCSIVAGWLVVIAARGPRFAHTVALALSSALCAISAALHIPFAAVVLALSASIAAWDLCLMERNTATHPREATDRLHRRYMVRNLVLVAVGGAATSAVYGLRLRISFGTAFALLCLCLWLFVVVLRHARSLMTEAHEREKEERTAEPPAS